jgi:hypothetical protein
MKCINCGTDNNLRDRQEHQGRCKNCGTPFAFEPTAMGDKKITDAAFLKILNDISANGTLYFTKQQLFYAIAKHPLKRQDLPFLFVFFFIFVLLALFFIIANDGNPSALPVLSVAYIAIWLLWLWFRSQNLTLLRRERLQAARSLRNLGIVAIGAGFLGLFFLKNVISALVLGLLGVGSINLSFWQQRRIPKTPEANLPITQEFVEGLLGMWTQAHGSPEKLLSPALREDVFPLPSEEVTNYSFDRLIVCQSDDIAKMLIANNVPFEYNSGVVSLNGYPPSLCATILTMAKRNPRLGVYVLHDCSADGLRCLYTVSHDPQWFGGQDYLLVDVGLSPRQILSAKKPVVNFNSPEAMRSALNLSADIRLTLSPQDLEWLLGGNYAPLEFLPPQKIIQALSRCIYLGSQVDTIAESESSLLVLGESDFYAVESFG